MEFFIDSKQYVPAGPEKIILSHIGHEVVSSLKRSFPQDPCKVRVEQLKH